MKISTNGIKWMTAAMLAVLPVSVAYATEGVVVGDAYVNSAHPLVNYGSLSNLYVNGNGTALLQFDLSSLPAGTTANQIGSASLKLYVNRVNASGVVNVAPVSSAWSESSVTYATMPSLGSAVASFTPATAQQFIVIDITTLVQGWVATPSSNFGIALTTSAGDLVLDSKENDETGHAAHLDITVVSQGPAGPQGPQGATGLNGTAATISVGSTTTGAAGSSASVTNSGSSSAAVLNFTVPAGATGPAGPAGQSMVFAANVLNPTNVTSFFFSPTASGDATVGGNWIDYSQALITMPVACTFDSLYANVSAVPNRFGIGGKIEIMLWINGHSSAISMTVDNTSGAAAGSQTGAHVPVQAGDTISLQAFGLSLPLGQEIISTSLHCE